MKRHASPVNVGRSNHQMSSDSAEVLTRELIASTQAKNASRGSFAICTICSSPSTRLREPQVSCGLASSSGISLKAATAFCFHCSTSVG
jgi:hypothetical protein